jgi:hypothetical protein
MTEHRVRKTRWPKGRVRALAWGTGGAAFVLAAAPLVATPKPPVDAAASTMRAPARHVIERHIVRRVVIVDPVSAPTSTWTASGSGSVSGGGAVAAPAPAPPPAPPTTPTGGT